MKVDIGPYNSDLIPIARIEQAYERIRSGALYLDEDKYTWFDKIVFSLLGKLESCVRPINRWGNRRARNIKVKVDNYDVWSGDHTIALIVHPLLVKLKEVKQGSACVDLQDVPKHLHPTEEAGPDNGYIDNTIHDRWDYVLDEMIWAFEQCTYPDLNEEQFDHNCDQLELVSTPLKEGRPASEISFNYQKDPSKPKYWVDIEGKKVHHARINNGLRLFGKYYFGLWD